LQQIWCNTIGNTCSGQTPGSEATRSRWRTAPAAATRSLEVFREFLEEKAGQAREKIDSVGRTGFREMIASGWQTAPPQVSDFEVVSVTKSACPRSFEASLRVSDLHRAAVAASFAGAVAAEWFAPLAPVAGSFSRASAPRILSAPTVNCA
jgi:hypothetical protein